MLTIDKLNAMGVDTKDGIRRCCGMESFYLEMCKKMIDMSTFEEMEKAVNEGNLDAAFGAVHNLKGTLGNLGMKQMLRPVEEMTELLRNRTQTDYSGYVRQILQMRDELKKATQN